MVAPDEIKVTQRSRFERRIFIEHAGILENIWFNTYNWKDLPETNIKSALKGVHRYDMIMVDFFKGEIIFRDKMK